VTRLLISKWTKAVIFVLCLVPLGLIISRILTDTPPNPIEFITHGFGDWTIRFICVTLAITPLRVLLKQPQLIRFRRMTGLYAFFYGSLHFGTWIFDKFSLTDMSADIVKRPFITVGFAAYLLMVPLAITSTAKMVRRLGYQRWQLLHRAIYVTAILAVVHYYWLVKSDVRRPVRYGILIGALLLWRLGAWFYDRNGRQRQAARAARPKPSSAPETA
jgi:methionine sulfoxide reductase heme-binding subunit